MTPRDGLCRDEILLGGEDDMVGHDYANCDLPRGHEGDHHGMTVEPTDFGKDPRWIELTWPAREKKRQRK